MLKMFRWNHKPWASIDLKNTTIKFKDGTGTPKSLIVKIGEGNLTYSEKRNMIYTLNRGVLYDVRQGDEVPMELTLAFIWEYLTGGSATSATPTIEDVLKKRGPASSWVSSDTGSDGACRPYALDLELLYSPQPYSCGNKETITWMDFRYEELQHDLRGASIQCSGRCNVTAATAVRAANASGLLSG